MLSAARYIVHSGQPVRALVRTKHGYPNVSSALIRSTTGIRLKSTKSKKSQEGDATGTPSAQWLNSIEELEDDMLLDVFPSHSTVDLHRVQYQGVGPEERVFVGKDFSDEEKLQEMFWAQTWRTGAVSTREVTKEDIEAMKERILSTNYFSREPDAVALDAIARMATTRKDHLRPGERLNYFRLLYRLKMHEVDLIILHLMSCLKREVVEAEGFPIWEDVWKPRKPLSSSEERQNATSSRQRVTTAVHHEDGSVTIKYALRAQWAQVQDWEEYLSFGRLGDYPLHADIALPLLRALFKVKEKYARLYDSEIRLNPKMAESVMATRIQDLELLDQLVREPTRRESIVAKDPGESQNLTILTRVKAKVLDRELQKLGEVYKYPKSPLYAQSNGLQWIDDALEHPFVKAIFEVAKQNQKEADIVLKVEQPQIIDEIMAEMAAKDSKETLDEEELVNNGIPGIYHYRDTVGQTQKVTKAGMIGTMRATVISGTGDGAVGFSISKSSSLSGAFAKATVASAKDMMILDLYQGKHLYHDLFGKFKKTKVFIRATEERNRISSLLTYYAAPPGSGLKCNRNLHIILSGLGIEDATAWVVGNRNPHNVLKATFLALASHSTPEDTAAARGRRLVDLNVAFEEFVNRYRTGASA